jgi:hypothetical protein
VGVEGKLKVCVCLNGVCVGVDGKGDVTGVDPITLDTVNRARCSHSQARKRSQEEQRLLRLFGQETQLSVLGTLELVLYTTSTEGYRTYWNIAEWGVRTENHLEHDGSKWKLLANTTRLVTAQHMMGPGSPTTLTHMATCTRVDF